MVPVDRPLRRNAALNEVWAELDARLRTLQRIIAEKRLARSRIKSAEQHRRRPDNLWYSNTFVLRLSGGPEADVSGACAPQRICDRFIRRAVVEALTRVIELG